MASEASPPGSFSSTQPLLAPASPAAPGGSNVRISVPQLFDGRPGTPRGKRENHVEMVGSCTLKFIYRRDGHIILDIPLYL